MRQTGLLIVVMSALLAACQPAPEHVFVREIPKAEWPADKAFEGSFEIDDTLTSYHFFITLRNTADYPYSNLYLFLNTEFPNGRTARDTVECILADRTGRWLGSGNGFIVDHEVISNQVMYQYNKKFPLKGTYKLSLEHAMRTDTLREIMDIGIRVEKAK